MTHPIVAAVSAVRSALKVVADANPTFMPTEEKAAALRELVAAEGQLAELRLRILADAGDLAAETAAKDAAGWLAQHTRSRYADARADLRLAEALDRERPVLAAAMREGGTTLAQARVIDRALATLPREVDLETVARAEAHLVEQAADFGPTELGRIGRRILEVVAPEIAEAAEGARLAELEAHAAQRTRLTMRRLGDGTTRVSSIVPDASATRLGVDYHWEERLGGRRRREKGSDADGWWRVEAFRAYAGHTRTPEFVAALDDLCGSVDTHGTTAVMCSEAVWWRCHRRLVADAALLLRGVGVAHLAHDGRTTTHEPSDGARVVDGLLRYDVPTGGVSGCSTSLPVRAGRPP